MNNFSISNDDSGFIIIELNGIKFITTEPVERSLVAKSLGSLIVYNGKNKWQTLNEHL